jgi:hypothetical protein
MYSRLIRSAVDEGIPAISGAARAAVRARGPEIRRAANECLLRGMLPTIDEFGVWPCDRLAATAFFTLISARYERGTVVLTSNKGFGEWGEVLGDPVIATAILDRLLHHSHVMNIRGESYRLREKKRAGLIGVGTAPPVVTIDEDAAATNPPGVGQFQIGGGGSKVRRR